MVQQLKAVGRRAPFLAPVKTPTSKRTVELSQVVADNPYPDETNPRYLHAAFIAERIGPDQLAVIATAQQRAGDKGSRDEATVVGRTLFLHTPGGIGRSELAAQLARTGGLLAATGSATMRNWATVTKLLDMCRS